MPKPTSLHFYSSKFPEHHCSLYRYLPDTIDVAGRATQQRSSGCECQMEFMSSLAKFVTIPYLHLILYQQVRLNFKSNSMVNWYQLLVSSSSMSYVIFVRWEVILFPKDFLLLDRVCSLMCMHCLCMCVHTCARSCARIVFVYVRARVLCLYVSEQRRRAFNLNLVKTCKQQNSLRYWMYAILSLLLSKKAITRAANPNSHPSIIIAAEEGGEEKSCKMLDKAMGKSWRPQL